MMHGHEKSRSAIVAVKPTNKAERSAAELVERRAETKGNVDQQRTRRTQRRICGPSGWCSRQVLRALRGVSRSYHRLQPHSQ